MKKIIFSIALCLFILGNFEHLFAQIDENKTGKMVLSAAEKPVLLHTLKRTGHQVLCAAINKYSIQYATGGTDHNIVIWDASDGSFINILRGHQDAILSVKFSPDSRYLASASKDRTIRYWDLLTAKEVYVLEGHDAAISSVDFNADGSKIVSASADNTIKVWEASSGTCLLTIGGFEKAITSACFSPDGNFIAAVSADKTLRIFGAESGEKISVTHDAHKKYVRRIQYSPDGEYLATVGDDGFLRIWQTSRMHAAGKELPFFKEIKAHAGDWVQSLAFSSDNKYILTGGHSGKIKIFDWQKENKGVELANKRSKNIIYDLALSYDGKTLVSAEYQNFAEVWDLSYLNIAPLNNQKAIASRGNNATFADDEKDYGKFDLPIDFDPTPNSGKNYLLVISADKYKFWNPLQNAVKDAKDLKNILQSKYGFKAEHTLELYDENVTKANIFAAFDSITNIMNGKDNLVIYYSGHGEYNSRFKQGFWVPVDGGTKDRSNYFSNTELLDFIGEMKSKHVFLIADACFSGALFSTRYAAATTGTPIERSRWGLTSGYREQVSDGLPNQNSPFAAVLLSKLRSNNKELSASQLIQEVITELKNKNVKQSAMGETLRLVGHESGEYVFKPLK